MNHENHRPDMRPLEYKPKEQIANVFGFKSSDFEAQKRTRERQLLSEMAHCIMAEKVQKISSLKKDKNYQWGSDVRALRSE